MTEKLFTGTLNHNQNKNKNKSARNRVTLELRNAKYAYEKNLAARIKTDNKLFWNYVSKNSKTNSQ